MHFSLYPASRHFSSPSATEGVSRKCSTRYFSPDWTRRSSSSSHPRSCCCCCYYYYCCQSYRSRALERGQSVTPRRSRLSSIDSRCSCSRYRPPANSPRWTIKTRNLATEAAFDFGTDRDSRFLISLVSVVVVVAAAAPAAVCSSYSSHSSYSSRCCSFRCSCCSSSRSSDPTQTRDWKPLLSFPKRGEHLP